MSPIRSRAAARREKARRQDGRFGEQEFDPADSIDLASPAPVPLRDEIPRGASATYGDFEIPELGVSTQVTVEHAADGTLRTRLETVADLDTTGPDGTERDRQWFQDRAGVLRAFAAARGARYVGDPGEEVGLVQLRTDGRDAAGLTTADLADVADRADPTRLLRDESGTEELEEYLGDGDDAVEIATGRAIAVWEADQVAEFNTVLDLDAADGAESDRLSIDEDDVLPASADEVTRDTLQFLRDRWDTIEVVSAERRAAGRDAATTEQIATLTTETYLHGHLEYGEDPLDTTPAGRALTEDAHADRTWKDLVVSWDDDAGGYIYARRDDLQQ